MKSSKSNRSRNQENAGRDGVQRSLRFEEACEMMKKNAAKFLDSNLLSDSSSSEDELDDSAIIENTFSHYSVDENLNLKKTREFLQDILTSGAVVCLICIESVKRNDKIWSCRHCFCMLHLSCIQKWAKDSLFNLSANSERDQDIKYLKWCCPKCRSQYSSEERPTKCFCFCGKIENPSYDVWNVPHSCGNSCDKKLEPDCGHTCCLLCHPGPCPPCPKTVLVSCCCGKSNTVSRRCSNKEWSCGKTCGKILSCKLHLCDELCHQGACPPCKKQSKQKCQCGKETKLMPCNDPDWKCEKVCGKLLKCGNHYCETVCHKGPCLGCPNSGPRPCPCGKKMSSLPCTDNIIPCGDTCNKLLECELHRCTQRCHFGPCEKCLQMRVMLCRCGQREKSVPCCKEFLCDIKCKRKRDCGKHSCNKKCCIGNCPPCEMPCGRVLNCGKHKCSSVCHPGPCYPCREVLTITCNCGATKINVPCGRKKSVPPRCSADCKIRPDCHHPARHKHKCHFGSCPQCILICGKTLTCGHTCPVRCHSAVLTKIEVKTKKEGPWDLLNSYKMQLLCKPCPPCVVPVPLPCLGNHEILNFPCCEARRTSCGRPCGRELSCGNHSCSLECHDTGNANDTMQTDKCITCNEVCQKPRPFGCNHPCRRPCHPGDCNPCTQHIKMKCHCEINTIYVACSEWVDADDSKKNALMSCSNRCCKKMSCGHRCIFPCHPGPCADRDNCKKKIILRCSCKRKKKEIRCCTQIKDNTDLLCDSECFIQKESMTALERAEFQKKKLEKEKQQEELESFLRKQEGKKRRKKKISENDINTNSSVKKFMIFASIFCIISVFFCVSRFCL
ncbi:NF-X1-type zinc finger protein NFXL1-like isoform X2 [Stegodyphus dumicola]|uniref:NF-X1-type zinc finger protein NFXL1-like isoform X2 n=1 Tax=Stegodyphus dumicola TaxID=202533 RepID=UPI0015ABDBFE|nr:NF-X1-type zinc finger protein NFXL1-like isoform X2 [Stegodyphus dumicola]